LKRLDRIAAGMLAAWSAAVAAQDAPHAPPRLQPVAPQPAGQAQVEATRMPVWVVGTSMQRAEQRTTSAASSARDSEQIPPPPRRRAQVGLTGTEGQADWNQAVTQAGVAVPLLEAVVRLAPANIKLDTSAAGDALTRSVSWSAGLPRAQVLNALLAANGLGARADGDALVISRVANDPLDDSTAWRARADAAMREYVMALSAERAALSAERAEATQREQTTAAAAVRAKQINEDAGRRLQERLSEPSPRVYVVRNWSMSSIDKTLRGAIDRWAAVEGLTVRWDAPIDFTILAPMTLTGTLPQVIQSLRQFLPPSIAIDVSFTSVRVTSPEPPQ
jgi:hypothetical protein